MDEKLIIKPYVRAIVLELAKTRTDYLYRTVQPYPMQNSIKASDHSHARLATELENIR